MSVPPRALRDRLLPIGTAGLPRDHAAESTGIRSDYDGLRHAAGQGAPRFFARWLPALAEIDLGVSELWLAHELAGFARGVGEAELHALVALVLGVLAAQGQGSTRASLEPKRAPSVFDLCTLLGPEEVDRAAFDSLVKRLRAQAVAGAPLDFSLSPLAGPVSAFVPLVVDGPWLYAQRFFALERRAGARLGALVQRTTQARDTESLLEALRASPIVRDGRPVRLDPPQEAAVARAIVSPLTLVAGGPGTGKTAIVVAMLRALSLAGAPPLGSVAIVAPTGKAADRLRSSILRSLDGLSGDLPSDARLRAECPPAKTLHALLGQSPRTGRFKHHAHNPLAERFVIVDESSMVDLALFERLLAALHPDAQLVMLGDADQLPSVAPGEVFRELVDHLPAHVSRLEKSHRVSQSEAGKHVLEAAVLVNAGDGRGLVKQLAKTTRKSPKELTFSGVELLPLAGVAERRALLELWYAALAQDGTLLAGSRREHDFTRGAFSVADAASLAGLLTLHARRRLLCVMRESGGLLANVDSVNAAMHLLHLRATRSGATLAAMLPGEPVLVTRNDHARGLFNGDTGVVARVLFEEDTTHRFAAVFQRDGGLVAFPLDALRERLELGYATTVHKAQGDEHDTVTLLLPDRPTRLATREIVYTAITRARSSVVLAGPKDLLVSAIAQRAVRATGLHERISG